MSNEDLQTQIDEVKKTISEFIDAYNADADSLNQFNESINKDIARLFDFHNKLVEAHNKL
tara:strand:+ start:592 stop:771 length:180 start_codon:yes stop_codon:yes gene_type:complete